MAGDAPASRSVTLPKTQRKISGGARRGPAASTHAVRAFCETRMLSLGVFARGLLLLAAGVIAGVVGDLAASMRGDMRRAPFLGADVDGDNPSLKARERNTITGGMGYVRASGETATYMAKV